MDDVSSSSVTIEIPVYPPSSDFPEDVLKWMKQNATTILSPQTVLKLMKCNKYFLHAEFPYACIKTILSPFAADSDEWYLKRLDGSWHSDIAFNDIPDKIWLTESLVCDKATQIEKLLPKIVVFDITELSLLNSTEATTCSFDNFKILISGGKLERLYIRQFAICDGNGRLVRFDEIFQLVPDITFLNVWYGFITDLSIPQIIQILAASKLRRFVLTDIPESFDFQALLNVLQQKPRLCIRLEFLNDVSPNYIIQLQEFVDKLIAAGETKYFPPRLDFVGLTEESSIALKLLRRNYKIHHNL